MKMIIALAALLAVAAAAPAAQHQQEVVLLRQTEHDNIGLATGYKYDFELSDGSSKQEEAHFEPAKDEEGHDVEALVVRGAFSFVGADGVQYTVNYVADKDGFRPEGAHLPVAPVA